MADLAVGSSLGNFEILKLLGKGGMGEVYLARDLRLNRTVALKILPDELAADSSRLERFNREAKAAASLNHPNICTIFEVGSDNGHSFISMEYVEGVTLHDRIARSAMEIPEVIDFAIQIADALEEARKKNLVHRDIKSTNILITERNQIKLLDFGLAKHVITDPQQIRDASTESHLTESGVVLGTVAYMSPEQALGKPVDHRTDLFSFGVVLYEMLTHSLPFSGNTTAELLNAIINSTPDSVIRFNRKVPDAFARIVEKLLEKNPEDRYQSAHEVWTDLRRLRTGTAQLRTTPEKKSRSIYVALILVALLIAAGSIYLLRPKPQAHAEITGLVALPCKVYGSKEVEYLTDAVPNNLSSYLSSVPELQTKVPPTSLEVQKVGGDYKKIAAAYNANRFVLSSIMAEENRFVLNVQLVEPSSKLVIWSRDYEGKRADYMDLTRQAAEEIRKNLRPESATTKTMNAAANTEAELAFQQGKYFSNRYNNQHNLEDFGKARAAFERALQLDPNMADAAGEIAILYVFRAESGAPTDQTLPYLEGWARKGLEINQKTSTAWVALGFVELWKQKPDFAAGREYAIKAIASDPRDSMAHLSLGNSIENISLTLALEVDKQASHFDPLYLYPLIAASGYEYLLNRPDTALALVNRALDLERDFPVGIFTKFFPTAKVMGLKESESLLADLANFTKEGKIPEQFLHLASYADAVNRKDQAQAKLEIAKILNIVSDPQSNYFFKFYALNILPFAVRHGDTDASLILLKRTQEVGASPYDFLILNPVFDPLRSDPQFQEIVSGSRKQFETGLKWISQVRSRGEFPKYLEKPLENLLRQLRISQT